MNYCLNQRKLTLKQFDTLMRVVNHEIEHYFHFEGEHKREIYLAIMNYGKSDEGLDAFFIQTIKGNKKDFTPVNFDKFLKLLKAYRKRRNKREHLA